jgi:hypothetical protein
MENLSPSHRGWAANVGSNTRQISEHHRPGELARAFGRRLGRVAKAVRKHYSGDNRGEPAAAKARAREAAAFAAKCRRRGKIPAAGKSASCHQDGGFLDHRLAIDDQGRNLADGVEGKIGRIA